MLPVKLSLTFLNKQLSRISKTEFFELIGTILLPWEQIQRKDNGVFYKGEVDAAAIISAKMFGVN